MTRTVLCPTAALLLWTAAGLLPLAAATDQIVLRVNERIVTSRDYERRLAARVDTIRRSDRLSAEQRQELIASAGEMTLTELFEELLVLSRADQLGITVTAEDLARAVARAKSASGIQTDEQFEAALAESGMTRDDFERQVRTNLLVQEVMRREVQPRVAVNEEDLRRYYQSNAAEFRIPERLQLREVVVLESSGLSLVERAQLAQDLRSQILAGASLAVVVAPFAGEGVTSSVLDLGWVEPGDLDPDLEEAVWGLEAGAVSEPVLGRGGLHLVEVTDRTAERQPPFSEVEGEIRQRLQNQRFQEQVQRYMEELQASSYVVAQPPPEAAGFRERLEAASALGTELADPVTAAFGSLTPPPAEPAPADKPSDQPPD